MSVLSPLRVRKPARDSINGSRRRRSRPSVELLEVRALLSNLLVNGDLMPPAVTGVSPNGSTKASGAPLARVGTGGPGSAHAVRLNLKTQQGPMPMGLLADGGFETPKVNPHKKARTLRAGDPALATWRITSGSVNVQTYWPAAEGTHTLDLNGISPGTIEQSFATTPGQVYQLAFDYGNNPDARTQTAGATVTVTGAGTLLSQQIAHAGSTPRDMKYTPFSGTFVADSATTMLQFASTTPGAYGMVLDAVAVTAEPFQFVTYTLKDLGTLPGGSRRPARPSTTPARSPESRTPPTARATRSCRPPAAGRSRTSAPFPAGPTATVLASTTPARSPESRTPRAARPTRSCRAPAAGR